MCKDTSRSGFSLIEVAIVLTIIGIVIGYALPTFLKYRQYAQFQATKKHQELILYSLASHLLVSRQIPCPADPAATDNSFGIARLMCTAPANKLIGIVPFRTLGIPEALAKDGFGRYFTYAIDPEVCNESFGFDAQDDNGAFNKHYCTRKGGIGSNRLIVKNEHGLSVFAQGYENHTERADDFVVAILVSHGPVGGGAFLKGGVRLKGGSLSLDEQANADSTLGFVDRPYSISNENPFHHIIKWVSHKNLAGLYGRSPCRVDQQASF